MAILEEVIGWDSAGNPFTDMELGRRACEYASAHHWIANGYYIAEVWPESPTVPPNRVRVWHFRIVCRGEAGILGVVPLVAGHLHLERDEDGVIRAVHVERVDPVTPFFYA